MIRSGSGIRMEPQYLRYMYPFLNFLLFLIHLCLPASTLYFLEFPICNFDAQVDVDEEQTWKVGLAVRGSSCGPRSNT
jgi:hypothetical protein